MEWNIFISVISATLRHFDVTKYEEFNLWKISIHQIIASNRKKEMEHFRARIEE